MTYRPHSADRYPGAKLRTAYTRGDVHAPVADETRQDWCLPRKHSAEWWANVILANIEAGDPWHRFTETMADTVRGAVAGELTTRGADRLAARVLEVTT